MIAHIKGILEEYGDDYVVIDTNGVGYLISMPLNEVERVKKQKGTIKVYTYHYVREDQMGLYGFLEKEALGMFKMLINISGVGPKAALSMLSALSPASMILAIISGDDKTLTKAQGVGKKLAQRIILELKDKFKDYNFGVETEEQGSIPMDNMGEALGALMSLGYTRQEAAAVLNKVDKTKGLEEIVKDALKLLMRG
jgi:holliday junction DNA helicase RuvA